MEEFEADVEFDPNEGHFEFSVVDHPAVRMTLDLPRDDADGAAFDWMVSEATMILIAGLKRLVEEVESESV